jgi:hypothetical protein
LHYLHNLAGPRFVPLIHGDFIEISKEKSRKGPMRCLIRYTSLNKK